jgi:hypothetical protein
MARKVHNAVMQSRETDEMTAETTAKMMQARYSSTCVLCGRRIRAGEWITWSREQGAACTTPTATVGVTGQTFYGHSPEHPAIVEAGLEQEHPGVLRATVTVARPAPKAPSATARWCRDCNDWEHNSCSGECRMYR